MTDTGAGFDRIADHGVVPPQAIRAERAVLAAMMLGNEAVGRAIESVEPIEGKIFYRDAHQKIFEAIKDLYEKREPADLITVTETLRRRGNLEAVGGVAAVAGIFEEATTAANLEAHIKIVAEKAIHRQLIEVTTKIQASCYAGTDEVADILESAERSIFQISDKRVRKGLVALRDLLKGTFEHIQALFDRKEAVTGVSSGFADLDKITLGFQPGDLIIIAGP